MVKSNLVLPGNLIVTLSALGALFLLVGIIQLMAAITGGVDFLGFSAGKRGKPRTAVLHAHP